MIKRIRIVIEGKAILLHPKEIALILGIRKVKYGEIVLKVRDGIPQRFHQITVFNDIELDKEMKDIST